jgi:predicted ATP-dependent endonuclease of OLD family
MTTHSTHLSEVSAIDNVNIIKPNGGSSVVMRPTNMLDQFGIEKLALKDITLSTCLERYLDAKRSVLLFSKGVILVEGDGEELLLPTLVKKALGISLDEIGIGLINVGNVGFENVACLFSPERLQRHCAIVTDLDACVPGADKSKATAEALGKSRKEKLSRLFGENPWVTQCYAPHTLEVDFAEIESNRAYVKKIINLHYTLKSTITTLTSNLDGTLAKRYDSVL